MKHRLILISLVAFLLAACNASKTDTTDIVEINITKALENEREVPLSEFVKKVEVLVLESNVDCYMQPPYNLYFLGKKYILFHENRVNQFYLFDRSGKFVRKIGENGKGPGEYGRGSKATLSKDESKIILTDQRLSKVMIFDIEGNTLLTKDLSQHFPSGYVEQIYCFEEDQIAFLAGTPYQPIEGYSNLVLFDLELNKIANVMTRPNNDDLPAFNIQHKSAFANKKGSYFWEMYRDTVYQFHSDGKTKPLYHFVVEKNQLTRDVIYKREMRLNLYDYTFPLFVNFIPNHLYISNSGGLKGGLVLFNQKSREAYKAKISNDIFALPVGLNRYLPDQNICFWQYRWGDYAEYNDLEKYRNEVKNPEIRDQLLKFAEDPSEDLGPVIVLMHMK